MFFWPVGAGLARCVVTSMRGRDVAHLPLFITFGHNRFQASGPGFALCDGMMLYHVRFGNGFQGDVRGAFFDRLRLYCLAF